MTFKYFFTYDTGICGTTANEIIEYDEQPDEDTLNQDAWQGALGNAEMYGIYPMADAPDNYEDEDYEGDDYSDNIEGTWEIYDAEKHDGCA